MKRFGLSGWVGFIGVAVMMAAEVWAARPAVIRGPERAFLRRGPGTEFQAYATVENGEQVTVDEVTGTWALVHLSGGQSGYVHAAFLFYADGQPVLVATTPTSGPAAAATAAPTMAVPATVAPTPSRAVPAAAGAAAPPAAVAEAGDLKQANSQLAAEVESLKREVETLRRNPSAGPADGDDVVALRAEVRRLADITDALRTRLDSPSSGALPLTGEEPWGTSTVVVLAGCALIVGWLVGGVLARREERGRRNRIRF
jgi:hypothetical protein